MCAVYPHTRACSQALGEVGGGAAASSDSDEVSTGLSEEGDVGGRWQIASSQLLICLFAQAGCDEAPSGGEFDDGAGLPPVGLEEYEQAHEDLHVSEAGIVSVRHGSGLRQVGVTPADAKLAIPLGMKIQKRVLPSGTVQWIGSSSDYIRLRITCIFFLMY